MIPRESIIPAQNGEEASYLVDQFCSFYSGVVALKSRLGMRPVAEPAVGAGDAPAAGIGGDLAGAQMISRDLLAVLEAQSIEAQRAGGRYAFEVNREAQYVMAALADEVLLNFSWSGRDVWTSCLLEEALFKSRIAGDRFFEQIDDLLRTRDPARRELALIYLLALSLGFQGRYRGTDCGPKLQDYRVALYRFRYGRPPDPGDAGRQLSPQAYLYTVGDARPQQLPYIRRWVLVMILVFVSMLGVSQLIWQWKADPLEQDIAGARQPPGALR